MIRKLFDARSTIWQLLFALLVVAWFTYSAETMLDSRGGYSLAYDAVHAVILGLFAIVAIVAQIIIRNYNAKYPDQKMRLWDIRPPEVLSGDEMFEKASSDATRKVYLYSNVALPILVVVVLFYMAFPVGAGLSFALYLTGYYLTYLRAIWPYLGND